MSTDSRDPFAQLTSLPVLSAGGCVTFVLGDATEREVLAAFGADDAASVGQATEPEASVVSILNVNDGLVAIEPNGGYQGMRPEVLLGLARHASNSRSASVHWDVNDAVYFAFVERSRFTQIAIDEWDGDTAALPRALRGWAMKNAESIDADPVTAGVAMAALLTGVDVGSSPPEITGSFFSVSPLPPTATSDTAESTPLASRDPEMTEALGDLSPEQQRQVAWWVTRQLLQLAELDSDLRLREVTAQVDGSGRAKITPGARYRIGKIKKAIDAQQLRESRSNREASALLRGLFVQHWASYALEYACHPDAATAAWRSVYASIFAFTNADILDPSNNAAARFKISLNELVDP